MRIGRGTAVALAALVVLAACGGDDDVEPSTAGGVTAEDEGDAADATPPAGEPDPDATLRFTWGTNASSIYDPHVSTNPFVNVFLYPAYDRLVNLTPEGEFEPMLAESWEFSEDGLALTLTLREGVVFHDGAPFDAEAVKANLERGKNLPTSTVKPDLAAVQSVEVVDPRTVRLVLSRPAASLPALLADRAGMMISPAAFDNPDLALQPVGAGGWRVVEHQPGNVIAYERFEDYWAPDAVDVRRIDLYMQLDPETRLRAVQTDGTDATTLNPDQIADAEQAGLEVNSRSTTASFLLYLNKTRTGLSDPMVRRALSLAIDRQGIAEALHLGECVPSSQPFPSDYWAGEPDHEPDPFDPEQARELLAQAGMPDGFSFSTVVVNVPFYVAQAEAIQAQLSEIGVDMQVTSVEPAELLARFTTEKSADAYFSQWPGATDPAKTVASLYLSTSFLNPDGYTQPQIEELAAEGLAITEQDERAPIYQDLSQAADETDFHLIVCHPNAVFVANDRVQNLRPNLAGSYDFRDVSVSAS